MAAATLDGGANSMMLNENDREAVRKRLEELEKPVRLVNFTQQLECQFCSETRKLLEEVSQLSDKVELEVFNFQSDREKRDEYGVDKIPATVIMGAEDRGVRYYGIPSGYEFASLLDTMLLVSREETGLSAATRKRLQEVQTPLHLEVFVTPT
jgi:glutaredoxin-like protein